MALRLGNVKPHVKKAAEEISSRFGITKIGGFRTVGSVPGSDHPKGLAIDVMTVEKGTMVAEWTIANARRLSVTYVIWNRRIYDVRNGKGWTSYSGPSPHTDHVHISFAAKPDPLAPAEESSGGSDLSGCIGWLVGR